MTRALSLSFTFELTIDDIKVRASNRPGDVIKLRHRPGGDTLDADLAAGGTAAYDALFRFAWQAATHTDQWAGIPWDDFIDRCEEWAMVDEPTRPTDAGPSSA